jgi:cathepsin A (carboxypeptidase C)
VGVGYSYCANQVEGKVCENTDKFTASASRAAIVSFFEKFPDLANNEFFITGESYAGIYIPTLAREIVDKAKFINLVGLAVGDPCTDNTAQEDAMDPLWYGNKYGLVDDATFDMLWNTCGIHDPPFLTKSTFRPHEENTMLGLKPNVTKECLLAWRKYQLSSSHGLSQSWRDLFIDDYSLFGPVTSEEDIAMAKYMNRPDVRKALNVEDAPVKEWPYPEVGFHYTKEYDACNRDPEPHAPSMIKFYNYLAPKIDVIWVYNGDTDPVRKLCQICCAVS